MLGRAADRFMLGQMTQTITAVPSNANGQSLNLPDMERPGTTRFRMNPVIQAGPNNSTNSGWMPGATSVRVPRTTTLANQRYTPGMEASQLPQTSLVPGERSAPLRSFLDAESPLGAEPEGTVVASVPLLNKKTLMVLGGLAIGAYLLMKRK